jgi:hypothetical protein
MVAGAGERIAPGESHDWNSVCKFVTLNFLSFLWVFLRGSKDYYTFFFYSLSRPDAIRFEVGIAIWTPE